VPQRYQAVLGEIFTPTDEEVPELLLKSLGNNLWVGDDLASLEVECLESVEKRHRVEIHLAILEFEVSYVQEQSLLPEELISRLDP
jgi:hypothetical protein